MGPAMGFARGHRGPNRKRFSARLDRFPAATRSRRQPILCELAGLVCGRGEQRRCRSRRHPIPTRDYWNPEWWRKTTCHRNNGDATMPRGSETRPLRTKDGCRHRDSSALRSAGETEITGRPRAVVHGSPAICELSARVARWAGRNTRAGARSFRRPETHRPPAMSRRKSCGG